MSSSSVIEEFYQVSKKINELANQIDEDMNKNEISLIEELDQMISNREELIEQIDNQGILENKLLDNNDLEKIQQIKEWEAVSYGKIKNNYESFYSQIVKLQHGKQVANRYSEGYGEIYTDGAYFDKRK